VNVRRASVLLALGSWLPACGGEDIGRPAPPEPATELQAEDWCADAAKYEYLNILDFEPAGASTAVCDVAGPRQEQCNWYAGSDTAHACKKGTTLRPRNDAFPGEAIPEGRCGMPGTALHVVGTRVAACIPEHDPVATTSNGRIGWGANFQVDALPTGAPDSGGAACEADPDNPFAPGEIFFDASCWDGISFWARKSGPVGGSALTITVTDVFTAGLTEDPRVGIVCKTEETAEDSTKCDAMGRAVTLKEDWNFYALPWRSLAQKGFGRESLLGTVDRGNIKGVTVLISPGDWDIWVDDIALFRVLR
jgi:hypothetical protein